MTDFARTPNRHESGTPTLVDRAYELIRQRIAKADPSPGELMSELSLSRELAIGRTPVREALQRLASQGLITIVPRRGATISQLGRQDSLQALELRRELDPAIASTAALRATFRQREKLSALSLSLEQPVQEDWSAELGLGVAFQTLLDACANPHLRRAAETAYAVGDRAMQRSSRQTVTEVQSKAAKLCKSVAEGEVDSAKLCSLEIINAIERESAKLPLLESGLEGINPSEAPSLTTTAYLQIEAKIVSGELRPGSWLSQSQLAKLLNFGKTTIREASLRLAAEHLVEISPRRGIFVAEVDFSERFQVLEARRPLERAISQHCALRISRSEAAELRKLGRQWVASAKQGDNTSVQMVDQSAKNLLLSICASSVLRHAMTPIFTLSRRLYFRMLRQPNVTIARGYASWLNAIADGDGSKAAQIAGFIAAEAEHLLSGSRQ